MNLDTLKVFCDLAETKSFSKAAEVNGITQSAVSQQIRALELKYQVALVERNRRACGLTPEGRTFLEAARRIVETYLALGHDLRSSTSGIAGRMRIAAEFLPSDLEAVTGMVASGALSLDGLVTHTQAAAKAADAYPQAFSDPACLKMVLDWNAL